MHIFTCTGSSVQIHVGQNTVGPMAFVLVWVDSQRQCVFVNIIVVIVGRSYRDSWYIESLFMDAGVERVLAYIGVYALLPISHVRCYVHCYYNGEEISLSTATLPEVILE